MYAVGIDLGGTNIKGGLIDSNGNVIYKTCIPTHSEKGAYAIIDNIAKVVNKIRDHCFDWNEVLGIGVAMPGVVDSDKGVVQFSGNLQWEMVEVNNILSQKVDRPIRYINDVKAALYGEKKFGVGRQYSDWVYISIGTGVGGGIVISNNVIEGNKGKAGEIGHMVIKMGGKKCTCGRNGCYEAYASATALINITQKYIKKDESSYIWQLIDNIEGVNGEVAFEAYRRGDKCAKKVISEYAQYLCVGLLNVCNIFRPNVIVFGGGIAEQKDILFPIIEKQFINHHYGYMYMPSVQIASAYLGYDAGIIGAATLWF